MPLAALPQHTADGECGRRAGCSGAAATAPGWERQRSLPCPRGGWAGLVVTPLRARVAGSQEDDLACMEIIYMCIDPWVALLV